MFPNYMRFVSLPGLRFTSRTSRSLVRCCNPVDLNHWRRCKPNYCL